MSEIQFTVKKPYGPLSDDEIAALSVCPFGEAKKIIRKHDPLYGLEPGQKIKWAVKLTRTVEEEGYATVEAASKEQAEKLANNLKDTDIDWHANCWGDDGDIQSIEPLA